MDEFSINDLMHLTRENLCGLSQRIEHLLPGLEAGTAGRSRALQTLANIRRTMLMRGLYF